MSPENYQNSEINFAELAKESVVASEVAVKEAVQREYIAHRSKEVEYPSVTSVNTDTGSLDNPVFAGFISHMQREYGPKSKDDVAVEFGVASRDNNVVPEIAIIPANVTEALITTPEFTKKAVSALEVISLTQELGVTFDVSGSSEPYDNQNPFATEEVIRISNIKDELDSDTGIQVVLLLGASSDFSSSIIQDDARASEEVAAADIADNAVVSSPIIIPRAPGFVASVQDSVGRLLSSEDPNLTNKVSLGIQLATRALEVVGEEYSEDSLNIPLSNRTAAEMKELKEETHPDFEWLRNLS